MIGCVAMMRMHLRKQWLICNPRQFLALVEYESKKKKRAAKAASEYMDRFKENIDSSNDSLKMRLANLTAEA